MRGGRLGPGGLGLLGFGLKGGKCCARERWGSGGGEDGVGGLGALQLGPEMLCVYNLMPVGLLVLLLPLLMLLLLLPLELYGVDLMGGGGRTNSKPLCWPRCGLVRDSMVCVRRMGCIWVGPKLQYGELVAWCSFVAADFRNYLSGQTMISLG